MNTAIALVVLAAKLFTWESDAPVCQPPTPKPKPAPIISTPVPGGYVMFAHMVSKSIRETLWAKMDDSVMNGPEDSVYIAPLAGEIKELLAYFEEKREKVPYIPQSWDCDDQAREFWHIARSWGREKYKPFRAAVCVGKAYIKVNGRYPLFDANITFQGYHVINVIRQADGTWFFFEPQTNALMSVEDALCQGDIEVMKIQI